MINPCFEVSEIEAKDKAIFMSLKNNINRGQIKQLAYFCSLVNKKGRIISFVSRMRVLLLMAWKDKPYTIGYIEAMRKLPPWTYLPDRKFQKELKAIKSVKTKDKFLEIAFRDEEQNWQLECQTKSMAKNWLNLIQNHLRMQEMREKQQRNIASKQTRSQNSQITLQMKERVENSEVQNHNSQKCKTNETSSQKCKLDPLRARQESFQDSSEASQSYVQLTKKYMIDKDYWLNKEKQYKTIIQGLKQENKELRLENDKLKQLNKQIRKQSARLKIGKSVLSLLKEQYQKKHLQFAELLNRKNFQIQKLLQKCADLILIKDNLQKDLKFYKKREVHFKQNEKQGEIQYDFQLSCSSNENSKEGIESQACIKDMELRNSTPLLVIKQEERQNSDKTFLMRQNTIY